ncbi:MAG: hypothetical protein ACREMU_12375 [Gemmatimonadaceae bacterium]
MVADREASVFGTLDDVIENPGAWSVYPAPYPRSVTSLSAGLEATGGL